MFFSYNEEFTCYIVDCPYYIIVFLGYIESFPYYIEHGNQQDNHLTRLFFDGNPSFKGGELDSFELSGQSGAEQKQQPAKQSPGLKMERRTGCRMVEAQKNR